MGLTSTLRGELVTTIWVVEREASRRDVGYFAESAWSSRAAAIAHVERQRKRALEVRWSITPLVVDVDEQP